ncbi:adenylyl-sulfate kinase [Alcanivorax sp. S6407]|uniref:adenylyl-sulfate kinase n=1 Tax=Alcanivorax sp. S6407 TaxID=2926424 RepID=UPI001FF2F6F7|nr:adenylyl-sulfate kinase [Alcanivorax sp. S6407]MCK0152823.1 adenylyl-sulfate kinase [Alcanivorax sp. S6407]
MSDKSPYQEKANESKAHVVWHETNISKADRAKVKGQAPKCLWLTGLSGAGKSTIANALEVALTEQGKHTYLLDGDNVRHGLNKNLGMSDEDRTENIRRVSEVAKLMVDAGLIVVTAFISPFRADRDAARALFDDGEFLEVFVHAPLEECEKRDPKGLYKKARAGEIKEFTGIDSPYEAPEKAEITINTAENDIEGCVRQIIEQLGL